VNRKGAEKSEKTCPRGQVGKKKIKKSFLGSGFGKKSIQNGNKNEGTTRQ